MKIRHGHVSNSSSSSFILGVDKPLDSLDAVREQIFAGMKTNSNGLVSLYDWTDPVHINDLCKWFLSAIENTGGECTREIIIQKLISASESDEWYDEESISLKDFNDFQKEFNTNHIYEVSFSDEEGSIGSFLEHGAYWNQIKHFRFSHH